MTVTKQWWSGALAAGLAAALLSAPEPAAAATLEVASAGGQATVSGMVTLVTGDRVTLFGDGEVAMTPHPSRTDIGYMTFQQSGNVYVLPTDAMSLVDGGGLDRELFNVSALVAAGLDDGSRDGLPLLVTDDALRAGLRSQLSAAGAQVTRELPAAEAYAVRADHDDLPALWHELTRSDSLAASAADGGGTKVWLDRPLRPALADSVPQVGAPDAWEEGYDGTGVTVAVIDSGVDGAHPDLAGKVVGSANFTAEADTDLVGHGTHVAATIAGSGVASGGANQGVAHGASLLSAKVCNRFNTCPTSAIIDGMQWAVDQGADVVNISLGGPDSPGVDPIEQAINNLTASDGVLFVVSAGNNSLTRSLNSPASADAALAVGAVDGSDALAGFSSRGPRIDDSTLKPDLTAPGVDVTAARGQDSFLPGADYTTLDGTSMAAPHVAGAAAILAEAQPGWSPELLKSALMGSAKPTAGLGAFAQGAGRLEVAEAVRQDVTAQPASVSLGLVTHDPVPNETVDRTVTYHNHGSTAETLSLSVQAAGPPGVLVPVGMFTLSDSTLLVPAGGDASVTLTAALDLSVPPGLYSGWITATGGGTEVRTPFGIERAVKLTITHTGRTGGAPTFYNSVLGQVDGPLVFQLNNQPGPVELWVPRGTFTMQSYIVDAGPGGLETSILTVPKLETDAPETLDMDAQLAQEVDITVPDPAAQLWQAEVGARLEHQNTWFFSITSNVTQGTVYTAAIGSPGGIPEFRSMIRSTQIVPAAGGGTRNAPTVYHTAWVVDNEMPTGFVRTVGAGELATVDAQYAAHVDDSLGYHGARPQPPDEPFGSGGYFNMPMDLPFNQTVYYYTGGGILWRTHLAEYQETASGQDNVVDLWSASVPYSAGSSQVQRWNHAAYGPVLNQPQDPFTWGARLDNLVAFRLPLFGDGAGHAGFPQFATVTGQVTLTRGTETIYDQPYNPTQGFSMLVPPALQTYQLAATAQRTGPVELGTELAVEWTFQSENAGGSFPVRLPLWSVQLAPPVDATNTAPAGQVFQIPVLAAPQPGSAASGLDDLTVEFSVDDGQTWQPATVTPSGGGHVAEITHPSITGFVSLRAYADDHSGNSVEQEVIRAYRIAP